MYPAWSKRTAFTTILQFDSLALDRVRSLRRKLESQRWPIGRLLYIRGFFESVDGSMGGCENGFNRCGGDGAAVGAGVVGGVMVALGGVVCVAFGGMTKSGDSLMSGLADGCSVGSMEEAGGVFVRRAEMCSLIQSVMSSIKCCVRSGRCWSWPPDSYHLCVSVVDWFAREVLFG